MQAIEVNKVQINSPEHYESLSDYEKEILNSWIERSLVPYQVKSYNHGLTSYGLKHLFEHSNRGFYVTNGQFKGAMIACGFKPKNVSPAGFNSYYQLSKKVGSFKWLN